MGLTYKKITETDLGKLAAAAEAWEDMAAQFKEAGSHYASTTRGVTQGSIWTGVSHLNAQQHFEGTQYEYAAAEKQAKAIASLIRDGHRQFTELKKLLESTVADAVKDSMVVDAEGNVRPDLSDDLRRALVHDPDGQSVLGQYNRTADSWEQQIRKYVQAFTEADTSLKTALESAVVDGKMGGKDQTLNGFNAAAEGDLAKAGARKDDAVTTRTDGWKSEGKASATGPGVELTATGPKYGKEGTLKAAANLGHATAEGSLTNGSMKLTGIADAYGGARATANYGITGEGLVGKAEVSAGGRGLAEGRAHYGHGGVYGRAEGFAGGEAQASAGVGLEGLSAGAKAFAGAKAGVAGGAEIAGIGAGGTAEGWAGVGAEAKVTLGKGDDGKFHIGAEVGVAVGLGGSLGAEFTVDPGKVADAAKDAADTLGEVAGAFSDAAGSLQDSVTSLF
ncbi:hypothetical protein AB0H29_21055 [Streptomyces thermolilacinus]